MEAMDLIDLAQGHVGVSYACDNELSGTIKCGLRTCKLLKKESQLVIGVVVKYRYERLVTKRQYYRYRAANSARIFV